jgi:hypothetical protein
MIVAKNKPGGFRGQAQWLKSLFLGPGKEPQESGNNSFYPAKHIKADKHTCNAAQNRPSDCFQNAVRGTKHSTKHNAGNDSPADCQDFNDPESFDKSERVMPHGSQASDHLGSSTPIECGETESPVSNPEGLPARIRLVAQLARQKSLLRSAVLAGPALSSQIVDRIAQIERSLDGSNPS